MMCGEIYWINLGMPIGSEPGLRRPVLIIQNDTLNNSEYKTVIVIPLTTNTLLAEYKGNVYLEKEQTGLPKDSVAVCPQILSVDKRRLEQRAGKISSELINEVIEELLNVIGNR